MAVHESFHLHVTTDKFYIQPVDSGIDELLVIDRVSQEISLQANKGQLPESSVTKIIYGIFGMIRLIAGPYLIVITKREKIGDIDGRTVWKVVSTEVLSFKRTLLHLTEQQNAHNKTYLSMLDNALKMESYYYSTNYDLTHSFQRLYNTSPDFHSMSLLERADPRFTWNGHLLRELSQQSELGRYCLPIVHGCILIWKQNV